MHKIKPLPGKIGRGAVFVLLGEGGVCKAFPSRCESIVETDFSDEKIGKGESRKDMKEQAL